MTILSCDDQTVLSDWFQANQHFTPVYNLCTWGMLRRQGTRRILCDSQMPAGSESLVVDKRKNNKIPGQHTSKAFKASGRHDSLSIFCLFRLCIKNRIVFTRWKTARLTPEHKKDDETNCSNVRAISLLNFPSKILEQVLNNTFVCHVHEDNNLVKGQMTGTPKRDFGILGPLMDCNSDLFQSQEGLHCGPALRDLFLICLKTWRLLNWLKSYNRLNRQPSLFIINLRFLFVFLKLAMIDYLSQ